MVRRCEISRRRQATGGNYGEVVQRLHEKCNVKEGEGFDPCRVVNVVLADDDVLSNMALRNMIEQQPGKYQVFPFYNGLAVFLLILTLCIGIRVLRATE